jgi:pimeloyl-ACP methyl ester carboxylesterase
MPVAENDGVEIAYEVTGADDGESVVLVSGLGYGRWLWQWQRPAFEDDYSVVLWDLRGVGESDTPDGPYTIGEMASDLEAVLADAGIESAHVVGISMGGMITQQYAIEYDRVRSLVLLSTDCGGDSRVEPEPEVMERILESPDDLSLREQIAYKMAPAFTDEYYDLDRERIQTILDHRTSDPVPDQVRGWQAAGVANFDVTDGLDAVTAPTLIMHGERDTVVPVENAKRLSSHLPHAELELYDEGGSHLFCLERTGDVNERLRAFVDGH